MPLLARTVQITLSGTASPSSPLVLTSGNIPFQPKEAEVMIGSPVNASTSAVQRTTGRAVLNADNTISQNYQSEYIDTTGVKTMSGTGKVANHFSKSGSSIVDHLVMSVSAFPETVPGTTWGVEFTITTLVSGTSLRLTIRG